VKFKAAPWPPDEFASYAQSKAEKSCGQAWGSLAAREPVWDGEGWGCDRVA